MRTTLALGLAVVLAAPCLGDDGDDTLNFYLSRSDLVVRGEIVSHPVGFVWQAGVANYTCDFRIAEVLKGKGPGTDTIAVMIVRFELEEGDGLPDLKKGGKGVLFLKAADGGATPAWRTADVWFGFQRPAPWMVGSLKRLAEEAEAKARR
jgi:hypothetical protein